MSNMIRLSVPQAGDAVLAASRQVWLATIGAAAVTREWAAREGTSVFRTLVKEGSAVEAQAIRHAGKRVGTSVRQAMHLVNGARNGVGTSVGSLASAASAAVSTILRALPAVYASVSAESAPKRARPIAKPARRTATRKTRTTSKRRTAKSGASK